MMADNNTTFSALNVPTPCRTCSTAINAISWSFGVTNEEKFQINDREKRKSKHRANDKKEEKKCVSSIFRWYFFFLILKLFFESIVCYTVYNFFGKYFNSPVGKCSVASLNDWHSLCFWKSISIHIKPPDKYLLFYTTLGR